MTSRRARSAKVAQETNAQRVAHALRIAEIGGVTLIQPMFVLAAVFSHMRVSLVVPLALHGIALLLGIAAALALLGPAWMMGATYLACLVDLVIVVDDQQLLFTISFVCLVIAAAVPILLWEGHAPLFVVAGVAVAGAAAIAYSPAGDLGKLVRVVLAFAALATAVVFLGRGIRAVARMIDAEETVTSETEQQSIVRGVTVETMAEYTRTLHDTVINTFALLARDHGENDRELIRERCRSNLERVEELRAGPAAPRAMRSLVDIERVAGVRVEWADDAKIVIRDVEPALPASTAHALLDCTVEAVTNAAKHAGDDRVRIEVRSEGDQMIVVVHDDGRGFDGELVRGRGLAESLFARARAHGIDVALYTAVGQGTSIELRCSTQVVEADTGSFIESGVHRSRSVLARAALIWSVSIHGASVAISALDPRIGPISLTASAVIVFSLTLAFWLVMRRGRDLPGWLHGVTLVLVPIVAWLGYEAGDQARGLGSAFPPMLITGMCVFLLVTRPDRKAFFAALALVLVALATTILIRAYDDPVVALQGIIAQVPALAVLLAWYLLHRVFLDLVDRMYSARERRRLVRRQRALVDSAQSLLEQWSDAGLDASLEILRDIGTGRIDLDDPELRVVCRREADYLRQVCAISSGGMLMSWWFARALATARAHGVELRLQVEGVDVDDAENASAFGTFLLAAVAAADHGTTVTASMISDHSRTVSLTIVAVGGLRSFQISTHGPVRMSRQELGEQTLIVASLAA